MKIYSLKIKEVVSITPLLFFIFSLNDDIVNNIVYIKTIGDGNNHISFGWENQDLKAYIDDSLVLQNIATYIDASNMSLQQLVDYKNKWRTPFLFYIDYTSDVAPDDNTLYGIASKEMLIAFSYSGNIYRCIDSTNWVLCSKDWDDLPNDLILRRIFDKDVNNSHMIEIHWQDGLQFWVDGGTMVFNTANFQAGVDTLYNACVSAGQTPTDKSPSSIANAIQQIANSVNITNLGSGTSIDVKSKLPNDYSRLSTNNFIVELVKITADGGARNVDDSIYPQFGTIAANATMSKSYNNITGILTISGLECHNTSQTSGWVRYVNGYVTVNVYAIY